jgi:hypothetical protein
MTNAERKKLVKALAKKFYPDHNGRKFRIEIKVTYYMSDYWDEGSRCFCTAVDLSTGEGIATPDAATNPYNRIAHASFEIPQGVGILERCISCGKDVGITLYVAPPKAIANIIKALEA